MPSLADRPELVGFFSYSRDDDEDSKGALSALRDRIQRELRGQLGRSARDFRLWQDKEAIAPGKLWEAEIKAAIEQSTFIIPIVTPTTARSPFCRFEFDAFLAREQELGRSDLIFPLLYIRVPGLEDDTLTKADPVLSMIARRQYVDWREFRHRDVHSTQVSEAIERLCSKIVEALTRPDKPVIGGESRQQQEGRPAELPRTKAKPPTVKRQSERPETQSSTVTLKTFRREPTIGALRRAFPIVAALLAAGIAATIVILGLQARDRAAKDAAREAAEAQAAKDGAVAEQAAKELIQKQFSGSWTFSHASSNPIYSNKYDFNISFISARDLSISYNYNITTSSHLPDCYDSMVNGSYSVRSQYSYEYRHSTNELTIFKTYTSDTPDDIIKASDVTNISPPCWNISSIPSPLAAFHSDNGVSFRWNGTTWVSPWGETLYRNR
jgi:hypothetical protein